jgi:hypothetical protein
MQRVFVSYSRKDIDFARKLAGDLEKAGFETWWDISNLKGGDDWVRIIPLKPASILLFCSRQIPSSLNGWKKNIFTLSTCA